MIKEYESIQADNLEESDQAQLLSITSNADAVARIRSKIPKGPSLSECIECGEDIPLARQQAVQGCTMCIDCQIVAERRK